MRRAERQLTARPRRRRRRPLRVIATLVTVLAIVTAGVVVALNRLDVGPPFAQRCEAMAGGRAWSLSPTQADNAALIAGIAMRRGLPARAVTIALATAQQESKLTNISHGDRDSLGLFQQRPSQGWGTPQEIMNPVYATNAFYDVLETIPAFEQMEVTQAAQAVQRSAFPRAYAKHESAARAWASALTGLAPAALTCRLARIQPMESTDQAIATVVDRIEQDLGELPIRVIHRGAGGESAAATVLDVDVGELAGEARRAEWAFGQWAVAVASNTGIGAVEAAGQRWSREHPEWEAIVYDITAADAQAIAGHVRITLPAPRR